MISLLNKYNYLSDGDIKDMQGMCPLVLLLTVKDVIDFLTYKDALPRPFWWKLIMVHFTQKNLNEIETNDVKKLFQKYWKPGQN